MAKQRSKVKNKNVPKISKARCSKKQENLKRKRERSRCDDADEKSSPLMERAEELAAQLAAEDHPHFIKLMLPSHVSGGFWLGRPAEFCREHLGPEDNDNVLLEDEAGDQFTTTYVDRKNGLSAKRKAFSIKHQLHVGDVLLFQNLKPHRFKFNVVHIFRLEDASKNVKLHAPCNAERRTLRR